jgi:glycosyltransferase involved in cell wall biosynthesis
MGTSVVDRMAGLFSAARVVPAMAKPRSAPLVSVVIPCYNYGHYLADSVGSVCQQQDGVSREVIIVDDASPDGSGDVAEEIAANDTSVSVIRHRKNLGHIATYNHGISEATGDYIVLLSADDLLTPGSLARATALMETEPGVGFVHGHVLEFSGDPRPAANTHARGWAIWRGQDWVKRRFHTSRNVIRTCEVVMRASVQREIGGYRPELPQLGDFDMWLRAAAVADVGFVLGADQAYYRIHGSNMHATTHEGRQLSGVVRDLQERRLTFELLRDSAPTPADYVAAQRALAIEALRIARRAYCFGTTDHAVADNMQSLVRTLREPGRAEFDHVQAQALVDFARETFAGCEQLPQWRAMTSARSRGAAPSGISRSVPLLADGLGRVGRRIASWPWTRLGS